MKRQIDFNTLAKLIDQSFEENNFDSYEMLCDFIAAYNKYNIAYNEYDKYWLIAMLRCLFSQCHKQNVDLNKYFPLFVEI